MIVTKLYKYDSTKSDYRGEDFSSYILQGDTTTDDLTEVLDTAELTLVGLPFQEEFAPTTKFILDKYDADNESGTIVSRHLVVAQDLVTKPVLSDDSYFTHSITFNEASVIAQGRLVDNIAITYRLKDVSLDGEVKVPEDAKAAIEQQDVNNIYESKFEFWDNFFDLGYRIAKNYKWVFPNWYTGDNAVYNHSITEWQDIALYQEIAQEEVGGVTQDVPTTFEIPVPFLEVLNGDKNANTFSHMGYCSVLATVIEQNIATGKETVIKEQITNPTTANSTDAAWARDWAISQYAEPTVNGYILNQYEYTAHVGLDNTAKYHYKKISQFDSTFANRTVSFTISSNCVYTVKFTLANFAGSKNDINFSGQAFRDRTIIDTDPTATYYSSGRQSGFVYWGASNNPIYTNTAYPYMSITFYTYKAGSDVRLWLHSAPTETAYNMFQKAQLTTQTVEKTSGVNIMDEPLTFYLNPSDKERLSNTTVVENFYNQKNFWEILLEIGKYIHSIPKVKFGENDRLLVEWRKLGVSDPDAIEYDETGAQIPVSIYNSKSVENYVSACSSYITNVVQLGGTIDEWIVPKSESEDYLVYNDVAELITSKPIIEIVDMEVKCLNAIGAYPAGTVRNLAGNGTNGESPNGYIFEESVYNILPVREDTTTVTQYTTNKGYAIYYTLGENKIKGFTYQLPVINTGDVQGEYAIKRIIARVFNIVSKSTIQNIKVNDFVFHIVYRTKDSARSDQTRPDLRKYMLNSSYDNIPLHNQFNNQTDIVVDSTKFGNNVYGKLIRTGNTEYTIKEWVSSVSALKHTGELYKINGDNYYVAKVLNTYHQDHIVSEVTYSKDYNQLSEIIGIPSEPRFYEISEQSLITREVSINSYLVLGTGGENINENDFILSQGWHYIPALLFSYEFYATSDFPKYAITVFKNDADRVYGSIVGNETFYKEICTPVSVYSLQNTLTIEWDMVDNFSAGDRVVTVENPDGIEVDKAYKSLEPVQYTDGFGRSDLMDFYIISDFPASIGEIDYSDFPNSPVKTRIYGTGTDTRPYIENVLFSNIKEKEYGDNYNGIALVKDNREKISVNYNVQMLTDSDRFVLSEYLWQPDKINIYIALLNEEINKISNATIKEDSIMGGTFGIRALRVEAYAHYVKIPISTMLSSVNLTGGNVKAIAIISTANINDIAKQGEKYFVMGRNITGLTNEEAKADWYITNFDKSTHKNKQ